ncbi:MAG: N-acetylmuramoyl-L-alanine amidase [Proteocatella sp.]
MIYNKIIRKIAGMTLVLTVFASGSVYAENIGKIDSNIYHGLEAVLEEHNSVIEAPSEYDFKKLITYNKDRKTGTFLIKLPSAEKVEADTSKDGSVVVYIPKNILTLTDFTETVNDRRIESYSVSMDGEKYRFEMNLQNNVKANCSINEATGAISIALDKGAYDSPKIVIDAGHGGTDPGTSNKSVGVQEKNLNLKLAILLKDKLTASGYEVSMNRSEDVYVPLKDRYTNANNLDADLFVSIHHNSTVSAGVSGIETLHYNSKDNKEIATYIQAELIESSGAVNRGTKVRTDLAVLNGTKMPAVLLELGFVSNANEVGRLMDSAYQNLLMEAVTTGINKYFEK